MATETTLAKVNVFSSESSYNSNKGSLGTNEISLVPFSGNTASKAANGYFKDADTGMIIQWGYNSNNGAVTITFPTPFPNACLAITQCSKDTGRIEGNPYLGAVTTTNFKFTDYGKGYWIAIGY